MSDKKQTLIILSVLGGMLVLMFTVAATFGPWSFAELLEFVLLTIFEALCVVAFAVAGWVFIFKGNKSEG